MSCTRSMDHCAERKGRAATLLFEENLIGQMQKGLAEREKPFRNAQFLNYFSIGGRAWRHAFDVKGDLLTLAPSRQLLFAVFLKCLATRRTCQAPRQPNKTAHSTKPEIKILYVEVLEVTAAPRNKPFPLGKPTLITFLHQKTPRMHFCKDLLAGGFPHDGNVS